MNVNALPRNEMVPFSVKLMEFWLSVSDFKNINALLHNIRIFNNIESIWKKTRVKADDGKVTNKKHNTMYFLKISYKVQIALRNYKSIAEYPVDMQKKIASKGWYESWVWVQWGCAKSTQLQNSKIVI